MYIRNVAQGMWGVCTKYMCVMYVSRGRDVCVYPLCVCQCVRGVQGEGKA